MNKIKIIFFLFVIVYCFSSLKAQNDVNWNVVEKSTESVLRPIFLSGAVTPQWVSNSDYIFYNTIEKGENIVYLINAKTGLKKRMIKIRREYRKL